MHVEAIFVVVPGDADGWRVFGFGSVVLLGNTQRKRLLKKAGATPARMLSAEDFVRA